MKHHKFKVFSGEHCETTATGTLLANLDIHFSEPMLFGLGEGLSYIAFRMSKNAFPFIGGRIRTTEITKNICKHLGLKLNISKTSFKKKAWRQVKTKIDQGTPVGLQLDCYHLEYFTKKIHFAGHYVAMVGYDEQFAYLVDTIQQGGLMKTTLDSLVAARSERGPMSARNLSYTIIKKGSINDLEIAIRRAIVKNAKAFINPPIKILGYKGILKTAEELRDWFHASKNVSEDFAITAIMMERGGTGGALFRNIYRDFLKEAMDLLGETSISEAHKLISETAVMWTEVANLFDKVAETKDEAYIEQASQLLKCIADKEYSAMSMLQTL